MLDLDALVEAQDHQTLATELSRLDGDETDSARRWYRRAGRKHAREAAAGRSVDAGTVVVLLAVALARTGSEAVKACAFSEVSFGRLQGPRLLQSLELAARRGREWCDDFVVSAALVPRVLFDQPLEILALCLPLVAHHHLAVPPGPRYAQGWAALAVRLQRSSVRPELEVRVARVAEDGTAAYAAGLGPSDGLVAYLRATPELGATLQAVLQAPTALSELSYLDQPAWSLEQGLRAAVHEGLVARTPLVEAVLGCYTRSDRPSEQRVTTQVLAGAGFGPADAAARVPFLLQVLPTVHGSVTAALLPALLAAPLGPEDLLEAGSTVLLRKEKAQKVVLLDRLDAITADLPLAGAALELWRQAARLDDRTLAARAERALERLGATDEPLDGPGLEAPWDDPPAPAPVDPFRPVEPTAVGLARLRTENALDPLAEARWLDLAVRYAASDLAGLRTEARDAAPVDVYESRTSKVLGCWAQGRPIEPARDQLHPRSAFDTLIDLLAVETVLRLGPSVTLLSTPSRGDGSLTFDDLVARLCTAQAHGYGPVDLLQALLRLEPTSPDRLPLLDGLEVAPYDHPPSPRRWWQRATAVPDDAVPVVRAWVGAGGLPVRVATVVDGRASCPPVSLPAVPPGLVGHPVVAALSAGVDLPRDEPVWRRWRTTWLSPDAVLGVVPAWPEAVAADAECILAEHRSWYPHGLRHLVQAPGPLGPAVHLHMARLLGGPDAQDRAGAVESVLLAVGQRRLDADLFARHSLFWVSSGLLPLARTSDAWEQVVLGGGLAFLWPTLRTVLQHATTQSPKPAGLAELLRMLRPYLSTVAANVPGSFLPDGVVALAGSASASKARAEARALVDALTPAGAAR